MGTGAVIRSSGEHAPCGSNTNKEVGREAAEIAYWQDGEFVIGFLNDYPDYVTEGMTKEELIANLKDLLKDIESGEIPYVRKEEELVVAAWSAVT